MKSNLSADISVLTTVPEKALQKLFNKAYYTISDCVSQTIAAGETVAEIDIDFGTLYIQIIENDIKYKFIPNSKLEKHVKDTVVNGKNIMKLYLEKTLVNKITSVRKDLM